MSNDYLFLNNIVIIKSINMNLSQTLFGKIVNLKKWGKVLRGYTQSVEQDLHFKYLNGNHEGITIVGFNRPQQKNALSINLVKNLNNAIDRINFENKARVVILRSMNANIFCAGADLKERATMSPKQVATFVTDLRRITSKLQNLPVPVLAALDGTALGGGLELALSCDIRVASSIAKLGLIETGLAIIPGAGGTQRLPRIVNPSIAKELIFCAKIIDGSTAKQIGLVNHVVDQIESGDAAFKKCLEIAEEILPNGPLAVKLAKAAINRGIEVDLNSGLCIEEAFYAQVIPTKDRQEGLLAFKEKRKPKYSGL